MNKTRIRCYSPVSALCQLTGKRPLPDRDSIGREQGEIPGLFLVCLAGPESGACWAEQEQGEVPGPV